MKENNNLNFLRLFFALNVVAYHCFALSQSAALNFLNRLLNPDIAVQGFFVVSGYLIFKSYNRNPAIKTFYLKRLKRIYPGYITVILLSVLLGAVISQLTLMAYFKSPLLYKYILYNAVFMNFMQQSLPGIFVGNYLNAVNGALWTLKIEAGFYLVVPLLFFMMRRINKHIFYCSAIICSFLYYLAMLRLHADSHKDIYLFLSRQLPGQLFFFLMGAYLTEFENISLFKKIIRIAGIPCILVLLLHFGIVWESIALAGAVFFVGFTLPSFWYPFKKEDISYGLYIYHFPIIQTLIFFGVYNQSPLTGLLLSFLFTFVLAILSWVFIEKPFITNRRNSPDTKNTKKENPAVSPVM